MSKDNGNWLSAQQAVKADGTEIANLQLITKKLPPLSRTGSSTTAPAIQCSVEQMNYAINFALDKAGPDGLAFLELWRREAWPEIAQSFPGFNNILPHK